MLGDDLLLSDDYEFYKIEKNDLKVGMLLHAIYPSTATWQVCGYVVTAIDEDGFHARCDLAHNLWFIKFEELDIFRLFTDETQIELKDEDREKIKFSPGYQNWVLKHDIY